MDIQKEFTDGFIAPDRLAGTTQSFDLEGLNGDWTILPDRSGGMMDVVEMLGLDKLDRMAWELSLQLSAPRLSLTYTHTQEGHYPILRVNCHRHLGFEYIRDVIFDGKPKSDVHLRDLVPCPPLRHMASGFDEGQLLAVETQGQLLVKYDMEKGILYMTRALLKEDPMHEVEDPLTISKYCVVNKAKKTKHEVYRYHRKTRDTPAAAEEDW